MSFGTWWRNKASDYIENTVLDGSATNACRYRTRDGRCHLPRGLDPFATTSAGWAVWDITDRGACDKDWPAQLHCPVAEKGPDIGGAPSPVAWDQGGQRDQPLVAGRVDGAAPKARPGRLVKVGDELRVLAGIDGNQVTLDDGSTVDASEVVYPTWHPSLGLTR